MIDPDVIRQALKDHYWFLEHPPAVVLRDGDVVVQIRGRAETVARKAETLAATLGELFPTLNPVPGVEHRDGRWWAEVTLLEEPCSEP